jgi:hypothetical protein
VFLNGIEYVHDRVILNIGTFCNLRYADSENKSRVNHVNFHCVCNLLVFKSTSPCRPSEILHDMLIVSGVRYLELVGVNVYLAIELEMEILLHIYWIVEVVEVIN